MLLHVLVCGLGTLLDNGEGGRDWGLGVRGKVWFCKGEAIGTSRVN